MENEVLKAIRDRRSTRSYKAEQISEEELQTLLEAAIQAPSASNLQPWHFTVIQDKELIDYISDKSKEAMLKSGIDYAVNIAKSELSIFYHAPTVIIVSGQEQDRSALVDCSAAIENMLIAAESIGLGTVWVGLSRFFFAIEADVQKLSLPEGYKPFYAVAIGYKSNAGKVMPPKQNRDVISYIR